MSKLIAYLIFINLVVINVESFWIFGENPWQASSKKNSVTSVVKKGIKKVIQNGISKSSVTTFIKNGVSLNCFGIPVKFFDIILEKFFTRTTKAEDVRFYIYSRDKNEPATVLSKTQHIDLSEINFSIARRTVVISHGFMSSGTDEWIKTLTHLLLLMDDLNVIAVDWQKGSNTWNYYEAAISTRIVGTEIAKLLYKIKQKAQSIYSISQNFKLYLVGHSLGAHISAHASYQIKQFEKNDYLKWDVERITGLDPAQPCFTRADLSLKLDKDDADYVDVIHSNGRQLLFLGLGIPGQLGHHDFYPNGGRVQTGCDSINSNLWQFLMMPMNVIEKTICSHGRSYELFIDSIRVKLSGSCFYHGRKWNQTYTNLDILLQDKCDYVCPEMGINAVYYRHPYYHGTYFVPTGDKAHYCHVKDRHREVIGDQLIKDHFVDDPVWSLVKQLFG